MEIPLLLTLVTASVASFENLGAVATELVNSGLRKFPRTDFMRKKHIQLCICSTLRLWKSEIGPSEQKCTCSSPEETGFRTLIPVIESYHAWHESVIDNARSIIKVSCQNDRLDLEPGGGNLCDD